MKQVKLFFLTIIVSFVYFSGCSENSVNPDIQTEETLLYDKSGLVDSIVGTCSAYMVRTTILDSIDTRDYNNIRIEFKSYTDGDLSNISFYYLNADTNYNLIVLNGLSQINNSNSILIPSPRIKDKFYIRARLFASVCTGHYYHLKIRDMKIYGIN